MKKKIFAMILVLCLSFFTGSLVSFAADVNVRGNSHGNIIMNGMATIQGNWIYHNAAGNYLNGEKGPSAILFPI